MIERNGLSVLRPFLRLINDHYTKVQEKILRNGSLKMKVFYHQHQKQLHMINGEHLFVHD